MTDGHFLGEHKHLEILYASEFADTCISVDWFNDLAIVAQALPVHHSKDYALHHSLNPELMTMKVTDYNSAESRVALRIW